jgi:hypothetical protein
VAPNYEGPVVINIEEYRARQIRPPTRWCSLLSTAAAAVGAVLNRDKILGPNQWVSLLSAPAEADNKLSFSGGRVGRSEIAPLLKICVTKDVVLDADSDREIDPAKFFQSLVSARHPFPPASVRKTLAKSDPEKNACTRQ